MKDFKKNRDPAFNGGESSDLARYQELIGCKNKKEYSDLILSALAGEDCSIFRLIDLIEDFEYTVHIDLILKYVSFLVDLRKFLDMENSDVKRNVLCRWGDNYVFGFVSHYEPILQLYFASWKKEDLYLNHLN